MLAKDSLRLETYRGMLAAFTNELVSKNRKPNETLEDEDALAPLNNLKRGIEKI